MTDLAVQLILAVLFPALLVCASPPRWLKRVMIGWLVAPVFVFFAVITWEVVTGPPIEDVTGRAWSGLMILSSILAAPWIAVSVVGSGLAPIFDAFCRAVHKAEPPAAISGDDERQQADCIAKFRPKSIPEGTIVVNGWHNVHIGFENDGVVIGGLPVWRHEWRRTAEAPVQLPHPAYPPQIHSLDIYEIGDETEAVRFAVSELSNGVWGFYLRDMQR